MDTEITIGSESVSFERALTQESDVLCMIDDANLDEKLYDHLETQASQITKIVGHHLGIRSHQCDVFNKQKWMSGRFNICIPVEVRRPGEPNMTVAFRCPKAHRIKTTVDEKMRAEISAQVWIEEHCPNINTPHLFGFGLANGFQFTHSRHRPFIQRVLHLWIRKVRQWLSLPLLSMYIRTGPMERSDSIGPYMVSEWAEHPGSQLLTHTWLKEKDNTEKRERLFRGIARIVLDLARIPQPRIGSLQFGDNGTVSLSGRYLTRAMAHYENQDIKQIIQPGTTYDCSDAFLSDLITTRLERCLSLRSRAYVQQDAIDRIAILPLLRAMSGRYLDRERRHGPYVLQMSDLHWQNVFVDEDWNITYLIDLEWINAMPAELQIIPSGIVHNTSGVAQGDHELVAYFEEAFEHFCAILSKEESNMKMGHNIPISEIMAASWDDGLFWFWYGLSSEHGLDTLCDSINPYFDLMLDNTMRLARHTVPDMVEILQQKQNDFANYEKELRVRYGIRPDLVL